MARITLVPQRKEFFRLFDQAAREMHGRAAITDEVLRRLERDLDLAELRAGV